MSENNNMNFTREVVESILEKAGAIAKNETIIGDPITFNDVLVVPVVKIAIGFGAGGGSGSGGDDAGKGQGSGGGAGGGVRMEPVCFLVHDGTSVRVLPAIPSKSKGMDHVIEKLPDLLTYAMDTLRSRGDAEEQGGERSQEGSSGSRSSE